MFYLGRVILPFSFLCYIIEVSGSHEGYEVINVTVGDIICLECLFSNQATAGVEWKHNKTRIMIYDVNSNTTNKNEGHNFACKSGKASSNLIVIVNGSRQCGTYECVMYSGIGSSKKITWIIQLQSEGYEKAYVSRVTSVGECVDLNCTLDTSNPPNTVKWYRGDSVIVIHEVGSSYVQSGKYISRIDNNTAFLEIPAADLDDSGVYSCFLSYLFYKKKRPTTSWVLQVQDRPHIFVSSNVTYENETLETTCCIKFGLMPINLQIQWLLNGRALEFDAVTQEFKEGNNYFCSNLSFVIRRTENQQSLDCLVRNKLNISSSVKLSVFYPSSVKIDIEVPRRGFFSFPHKTIKDGQLQCVADGNPLPAVTLETLLSGGNWQMASVESYKVSNTTSPSVWTFKLGNIDYGFYRCTASNGIGQTQVSQGISIDADTHEIFIAILCLAAITTLAILLKLAMCIRAFCKRSRKQEVTSTNTARIREIDDIGSQGNYENIVSLCHTSTYVGTSSHKNYSRKKRVNGSYLEKSTSIVGSTENHEEDYMNSIY